MLQIFRYLGIVYAAPHLVHLYRYFLTVVEYVWPKLT